MHADELKEAEKEEAAFFVLIDELLEPFNGKLYSGAAAADASGDAAGDAASAPAPLTLAHLREELVAVFGQACKCASRTLRLRSCPRRRSRCRCDALVRRS